MTASDKKVQELLEQVSELKLRLKELRNENSDFRELCNLHGIYYEDWLAARRHQRYFTQLRADHPIGRTAQASGLLGAPPIVRQIAGCAGAVLCTGRISRCFFAAFSSRLSFLGDSAVA